MLDLRCHLVQLGFRIALQGPGLPAGRIAQAHHPRLARAEVPERLEARIVPIALPVEADPLRMSGGHHLREIKAVRAQWEAEKAEAEAEVEEVVDVKQGVKEGVKEE